MLYPDGTDAVHLLGHDLEAGQLLQLLVPGGVWQGLCLSPASAAPGGFALMGTTMAPGFDPANSSWATGNSFSPAIPGGPRKFSL